MTDRVLADIQLPPELLKDVVTALKSIEDRMLAECASVLESTADIMDDDSDRDIRERLVCRARELRACISSKEDAGARRYWYN